MKFATAILALLAFAGCAQHHCRRGPEADLTKPGAAATTTPEESLPAKASGGADLRKVFIYKYDGSLQCKQGKAISLESMAKELKGLTISSQNKKADGLMHIQVCGSPTGMANVFEINESDLPKAEKLGFKKWSFE